MSEAEKKKRDGYRKKRRVWLVVLTVLVVLATILTAVFGILFYRLNKTLYIDYKEEGKVDYQVQLKPNEFYEGPVLGSGQAYVASLVDRVNAEFSYALQTDAQNVNYEYAYRIDTQLIITDRSSGVAIFNPIYHTKPEQTFSQNTSNALSIYEQVSIDYGSYNELAQRFVTTYQLSDTTCALVVRMHIRVLSVCADFEQNTSNEYTVSLRIPLTARTVNIEMTSTVPAGESKILACENNTNRVLLRNGLIISGAGDALLLIALVLVALLTRNHDINYTIRVKRLLAAYRSYIQRINNRFDAANYQVLRVNSFNEMLEIRDTVGAPILMYENEDLTCTEFMIPAGAGLLYLFEIKVEDYDEIYKTVLPAEKDEPAKDEPAAKEEPVVEKAPAAEETPAVEETPAAEEAPAVEEAPVEEAPAVEEVPAVEEAPAVEEVPAAEELPAEEESAEAYGFGTKYDYSFEARLALADDEAKGYWRGIVAFAKSYGVKVARSWARERIYLGRNLFAIITFKGKKLALAFAIDPKTADPKYHAFDMSGSKKYERTPMLMRISSPRKLKFAQALLAELFLAAGLTDKNLDVTVAPVAHRTKEELLQAELIKPENR